MEILVNSLCFNMEYKTLILQYILLKTYLRHIVKVQNVKCMSKIFMIMFKALETERELKVCTSQGWKQQDFLSFMSTPSIKFKWSLS